MAIMYCGQNKIEHASLVVRSSRESTMGASVMALVVLAWYLCSVADLELTFALMMRVDDGQVLVSLREQKLAVKMGGVGRRSVIFGREPRVAGLHGRRRPGPRLVWLVVSALAGTVGDGMRCCSSTNKPVSNVTRP